MTEREFLFSMVADEENPLVLDILHADSSAYSFNPDEPVDEVLLCGAKFVKLYKECGCCKT